MALNVNSKELVIDPHKSKERYLKWCSEGRPIPEISAENREILLKYLKDMELGKNASIKQGSRGNIRLLTLLSRMRKNTYWAEVHYKKLLVDLIEDDILELFKKVEDGVILKDNGKPYQAAVEYSKIFKAFWHWYMKMARRELHKDVFDITSGLACKRTDPEFNYLTPDKIKVLINHAISPYRFMIMLDFDSGVRGPTEIMNLKKKDFEWRDNYLYVTVREDTSKTFGRTIKLILYPTEIWEYIKDMNPDDFIFKMDGECISPYLTRLGFKHLGIGKQIIDNDGKKVIRKGLTIYDVRHSSACYWVSIYKNTRALMNRFGWKKREEIDYYTKRMGLDDNELTTEIIMNTESRSNIEKELADLKQKFCIREDYLAGLEQERNIIHQQIIDAAVAEIRKKLDLQNG